MPPKMQPIEMEIATSRVIEEVKKRPEIWNLNCEQYKDKQVRQRAWTEILSAVVPDFDNFLEPTQQKIRGAVHQRWKTARDAYMRSKALIESGANIKKYFYFDQCKFLDELPGWYKPNSSKMYRRIRPHKLEGRMIMQRTAHKNTQQLIPPTPQPLPTIEIPFLASPIVKQEPDDYDIDFEDTTQDNADSKKTDDCDTSQLHTELDLEAECILQGSEDEAGPSRFTISTQQRTEFDIEVNEILKKTASQLKDDDMCFFKSMLPTVKKFSDRQKLLFRSKVIEVAMKISEDCNEGK